MPLDTFTGNGHLNVGRRDHDSVVTGYGKHDRVVCFLPQGDELYMRIDHKWDLGMPTEQQLMAVARKDQGVRGRWKLDRMEPWSERRSTDVYFVKVTK